MQSFEAFLILNYFEIKSDRISAECGIYGSVSSGTAWRFLKLEGQIVTIDLTDYPLPPVDKILGFLVWMVSQN
ncbi:MAG: hypothetical protein EAZ60_11205 [Oscillatoriales cyanobacterium]|nr:MAG: hypothetical protein EAZ83_03675 [Oscillatoriales cyanobacterium]TAE96317.1 MAG: hypothetical protein EAZ79_15305 [Oscillatoriales cyanobacterium]TAF22883.1 MAG: hypothetical protein EAZ73_03605 [Oscillatoriales cyanobacterium]TAF38973.1 MAG: hypothetical protein EAZ69_02820 [Oscillatoriales cyanobacterium]TAF56068.1 MAG: hypothetical protein EAZ60_11205 [Oscillatoriales cyanobacterium]